MNRQIFLKKCEVLGLGPVADALYPRIRPCHRLIRFPSLPGQPEPRSGLGGWPLLPPDFEWPHWNDRPLGFVAQIDLTEVPLRAGAPELPAEGLLSFFYDTQQGSWGFTPEQRDAWAVHYFPEIDSTFQRVKGPEIVFTRRRSRARRTEFPAKPVQLLRSFTLPHFESTDYDGLGLDVRQRNALRKLHHWWQGEGEPEHQLLGHADPVHGPMEAQCELVSNGIDYFTPEASDLAAELKPGSTDWRLLLQVDSDEDCKFLWGDSGMIYYWIRQRDLEAWNFDRAWLALQCF